MNLNLNIIDRFILVGDRILLKPKTMSERTRAGLYLPPGFQEKEKLQSGYVVKLGPGYPVGPSPDVDEPWKEPKQATRYIPLQAQEGDLAIYLQNQSYEFEYEQQKYVIVPQSAVLLLIREGFFEDGG